MNRIFNRLNLFFAIVFFGILPSAGLFGQSLTITGVVTSKTDGEPLPGAMILEKGTNNGVVSSFDGRYQLEVSSSEASLEFSFMGFLAETVKVDSQRSINVGLKEDVQSLEEVVVVGYGTACKKLATGNYNTIKPQNLGDKINTSFQEGLQGMAAGVNVTGSSGAVGGAVNIRVRGTGSLSSSSNPLYVIDGLPFTSYPTDGTGNFGTAYNPMTNINPDDIESLTVLKDAEATAIYGSRGANGVILIKTKSGKKGKASWTLNYSEGVKRPTHRMQHLNATDWINYTEEAWENSNVPANKRVLPYTDPNSWYTEAEARNTDIDKYDMVLRQARMRTASLAVSGGTDGFVYRLNGSYDMNEGILQQNDNDRLAFSANVGMKISERMKFNLNTKISNVKNTQYPTNSYFLNIRGHGNAFTSYSNPTGFNFIRNGLPQLPTHNPDGTFFKPTALFNVATTLDEEYFYHKSNNFTAINSGQLIFDINSNFRAEANLSLNYTGYEREVWFSPLITTKAQVGRTQDNYGYADAIKQARFYTNMNAFVEYNKELGKHEFATTVGTESYLENQRFLSNKGVGFPQTNSLKNVGSANEIVEWRERAQGAVFYSGFARFKYGYDNRYLFGMSVRTDGSSRFGAQNRWGTFPSASVGWNISEEAFMANNKVVNYLKLRSSYGISGNAEIEQNAAFYSWQFINYSYAGSQGLSPLRLKGSTDNIGWEKAYAFDLGMDFELFEGVLKGDIAYYSRTNSDLLANLSLPPTAGGGNYITNSGKLRNSGLEFSLNALVLQNTDWSWNVGLNGAFLKNEVVELSVDPNILAQEGGVALPSIGGSVASYRMVKWLGVDPETGNELFEDPATGAPFQFEDPARPSKKEMEGLVQDIDGKTGLPTFTGAFNNSVSYKGLSLSFNFYINYGNWLFDEEIMRTSYMATGNRVTNVPQFVYDQRWQQPGDQTDVPRVIYDHPFAVGTPDLGSRSTRFLYDGSFIRLQNVTLGYTLPKALTSRIKMKEIRVFASGSNLWTITKYPGWDPESVNSKANFSYMAGNIAPGVIRGNPPQAMSLKLGVNLKF
ncbi:SusC/RagA family TonB-linked outer membrane protein [Persicobacter psychrovividus]|uniref:SusC/RagA family TonB-linked outer membrane protein n=1 Tax=Persicobacter psychrovividus TaxID=387638 RepID=A0ABN6LBM6_9BACT|nr:SusC/RagA family TonB-linked outer membrane protein [Persicobacter psychrovividus]